MKAGTRAALLAVAALAIGLIGALPAGAGSGVSAERGDGSAKRGVCFEEARRDLVADYVYSLKARNLGCDRAEKLVEKFHKCRHANGGSNGHCGSVEGYSCTEKKLDSSPTLYQAKGKCEKGSKKFVNTFGEFR